MTRPVIIGGGPAGAVAALRLAQRGQAALLLERHDAPQDVICGEFLSAEAVAQLAALGVDVRHIAGVAIDRVEIAAGRRRMATRLPFVAHSIRRRELDDALLNAASRAGAEVQRGVRVQQLHERAVATSVGDIATSVQLLATGKHALSGQPRRESPAGHAPMIGFKQYFRATPPLAASLARTVRVVLYEGGYAGVQLVSPDVVNLCLVVHRATLEAIGGNWEGVCRRLADEPMLRPVLDAEPLLSKPLAISGVPYGFLAQPDPKDRVYRLGDQAAVIPSFCGDGMAIAIHSGVVAADAVIDGADAYMYQRRLLASTRRPVQIALQVQRIAQHPVARMAALAGLTMLPGAVRLLARLTRMPNHPRS